MVKVWTWIRHNQASFVALLISAGVLIWTLGCEAKVTSLIDPTRKVNRLELNTEIEIETARLQSELDQLLLWAEQRGQALDRQDELRQKLMDFALLAAQGGALNPSGLVGLVAGIIGVGAVVDNRLKDKVIKNRPLTDSVGRVLKEQG